MEKNRGTIPKSSLVRDIYIAFLVGATSAARLICGLSAPQGHRGPPTFGCGPCPLSTRPVSTRGNQAPKALVDLLGAHPGQQLQSLLTDDLPPVESGALNNGKQA